MKPHDEVQRATAGELISEEEKEAARPDEGRKDLSPEEAHELARKHQEEVAEGRARVGEGDPNAGQNAQHRGSIHPGG